MCWCGRWTGLRSICRRGSESGGFSWGSGIPGLRIGTRGTRFCFCGSRFAGETVHLEENLLGMWVAEREVAAS